MIATIFNSTAPPWALKWPPLLLTFLCFFFFAANALKNALIQPHTSPRYINDIIFMISTEGLDNLKIFIDYLNNIHSTIKFTLISVRILLKNLDGLTLITSQTSSNQRL